MSDAITFKEPVDSNKVCCFLNDNVNSNHNLNTFTWEYKKTPCPSIFRIIEDKHGEIIASQGFVTVLLTNPKFNNTFLSGKSESTFAKKVIRGKGVYEKFYLETLELANKKGIYFFWGFTFISDYFHKKLGYNKDDDTIVTVFVTLSLKRSITDVINSKNTIWQKTKKILSAFKHTSFSLNRFNSPLLMQSVSSRKASDDFKNLLFINSEKFNSLCCILYDVNYFNWRYDSNPLCKYEYVSFFDNGKVISSAVINVTSKETAIITDVVFHHEYSLKIIVASLLVELRMKGFSGVEFYANKANPLLSAFVKALKVEGGKVYSNQYLKFVYRYEDNNQILLEDLYITGSWTEGFRI